ncbi:hypothetical protein F5X68DRAFT_234264 [Plectosphaerella plurivora]|uniref:Uncharacterized protein n=1 Tax=Plectosphaerella plurivora TaxID=936078 RepID=A0A9P9A9G3_9PEZI|nr:hypothetical protein F5X68DRAFT_234264 [Plectosphaerella plurivora]
MARETPASARSGPPSIANSHASSKPLPARPGTSGTEMLLTTKRRHASEKLQKAQRAERAYKAKKRTAIARADLAESKEHFRKARHHLREGLHMFACVVKSVPYVIGERRESSMQRKQERQRKRDEEKKKRLEERWAAGDNSTRSDSVDAGTTAPEDEAADAEATPAATA